MPFKIQHDPARFCWRLYLHFGLNEEVPRLRYSKAFSRAALTLADWSFWPLHTKWLGSSSIRFYLIRDDGRGSWIGLILHLMSFSLILVLVPSSMFSVSIRGMHQRSNSIAQSPLRTSAEPFDPRCSSWETALRMSKSLQIYASIRD